MSAYEEIKEDLGNVVDLLGFACDDAVEKFRTLALELGREHPDTIAAWETYDKLYARYETAYKAYIKIRGTTYDDS